MKQGIYIINENKQLAEGIYRMRFAGDVSAVTAPGQFINIKLDGHFLRRPISVCDVDDECITIIYKVLGHGTEEMTHFEAGTELDVLTGLGNGYDTEPAGERPLLIGGGVGIPPLYMLAKRLIAEGREVTAVLGFNSSADMYYVDEFERLGCRVVVTTADGSSGIKGFVTDGIGSLTEPYTYFYTCGPEAMLKAVYNATATDGQFSFEERMGCGFGACMGCTCRTVTGFKRICREGPVLGKEEILW